MRIEFEGAVYHITSRGNAGTPIFLSNDDMELFLKVLGETVDRFCWICHAYCLIPNHYHLLVETPHGNLSRGMRHLNGVYTQSFNRTHKRTGHVFQGRFKAILVDKESHLLEVARYVVLNPVRAKMSKHPREWKWSSYRATSGESTSVAYLTSTWHLEQFDSSLDRARLRYRQFVKDGRGASLWDDVKGGVLLGSEEFIEHMRPLLRDASRSKEITRAERLLSKPSLAKLLQGTEMDRALRNRRIHDAVRTHGYTLFQLQEFLGLHYSTISRIASRVRSCNPTHEVSRFS